MNEVHEYRFHSMIQTSINIEVLEVSYANNLSLSSDIVLVLTFAILCSFMLVRVYM